MGQKTHPNILRLGVTKSYKYRYIEKKSSEISKYSFNNLEIEKFIYKFFKDNRLYVTNCKINYAQDEILQIFISYYAAPYLEVFYNEENSIVDDEQKLDNTYNLFNYLKTIKKKPNVRSTRKKLTNNYRDYLNYFELCDDEDTEYENIHAMKHNYFVNLLCESISKFLNKKVKIFLTLKQINKNSLNYRERTKFLDECLARLNRYKKSDFFEEGVDLLYTCSKKPGYAVLIAEFLASQLKKKKLKRHNFFFYFIRNCLRIFRNKRYSKTEGIKIKIKGRLNRRRRARRRIFKIGKRVPTLSIKSKIDYSENVAFTPKGTIGIKIWAF